jgi:hypothetical protein
MGFPSSVQMVAFGRVWNVVIEEGVMPDVSEDSYLELTQPERNNKTNAEIRRRSLVFIGLEENHRK